MGKYFDKSNNGAKHYVPTEGLDTFTRAYVECALWSSNDESNESGGEPLDKNYDIADIDPKTLQQMKTDCANFQNDNWNAIQEDLKHAGQDFWLTRNHHGAGFWDGDWKDGEKLTEASHCYGEVNLYVGDDGKIYCC